MELENTTKKITVSEVKRLDNISLTSKPDGGLIAKTSSSTVNVDKDGVETPVDSSTIMVNLDMTEDINIINPESGEPTGTSYTTAELYTMFYSLHVHIAKQEKLDNKKAEEARVRIENEGPSEEAIMEYEVNGDS